MSVPTTVVTGEGVAFDLPRAGIGSRIVATVVDLALQSLALIVLSIIDSGFSGTADDATLAAVLIIEFVLVIGGYPIVCEWLTRGRTLGKLWLGLRVVRDDGGPISFRHALVRGLSSLILEKPGLFVVGGAAGLITAGCSSRDKRIGDMLAGTFVLNERAGTSRRPVLQDLWVPPWLQPWAAALDLSRVDDGLALTLRQFVARAPAMNPAASYALGEDLRHRVLSLITPPPPPGTPTPALLTAVLAERRRRAVPPPVDPAGGYPTAAYPTGGGYPPAAFPWPQPPAPGHGPRPAPPSGSGGSPFTPPG